MNEKHIVLGASGPTGRAVIEELQRKEKAIVGVSRSGGIAGVENRSADLLDYAQAGGAVAGGTHVYLCVGLPYDTELWIRQWPVIVKNVIAACQQHGARLIFLDNVYMYGPAPLAQPFDENHSQEPSSKKGAVRKRVADAILSAHKAGHIQTVIGRSADFYGPGVATSMLQISYLDNMTRGKRPQWIGFPGVPHTYAYVPDNGRALVTLALDPSAYGEAWHLPVSSPVTPEEVTSQFNTLLGTEFQVAFMRPGTLRLLSLFVKILGSVKEMAYQFYDSYLMDDRKFRTKYPDFIVTPFGAGAKAMADAAAAKVRA